jgi:hypothetical protein
VTDDDEGGVRVRDQESVKWCVWFVLLLELVLDDGMYAGAVGWKD